MTISPPEELIGARKPSHLSVPPAVTSAGQEAVDLARQAGLILDPWQQDVLAGALGEDVASGNWAAMEVGLVVPRQNGKGAIIEARELAGLFLFGEELIIHSAHLFDTSLDAFRRILHLIEENPEFNKQVKRKVWSHGEEGIELKSGQRLRFKTRTKGGGRGLSGDTVILDEAYNLPATAMSALLPTLSARPNPQVWYTSSAPLEDSVTLRNLCKRGRGGLSPRLAYFEWCSAKDADSTNRSAWADANPGLGIRLSESFTETELNGLEDGDFRRERLGIWHEDGIASVIDPDAWRTSRNPRSRISDRRAFTVDVTPDRSRTSIVVAGSCGGDRVHVELVERGSGLKWAPKRIKQLLDKWGGGLVLDPSSPAGSLIPELGELGVEPYLVSARDHAQACGLFVDLIAEDRLRHIGQPELDEAIAGARRRDIGDGAWKWSRKDSTVDISPLVGATLAAWMVASAEAPSVYESRGMVSV